MNEDRMNALEAIQYFINHRSKSLLPQTLVIAQQMLVFIYSKMNDLGYQLNANGEAGYFKHLTKLQQSLHFSMSMESVNSCCYIDIDYVTYQVFVSLNPGCNNLEDFFIGVESLLETLDDFENATITFTPWTNSLKMNYTYAYSQKKKKIPRKDRKIAMLQNTGQVHDTLFVRPNNKRRTF